MHRRSSIWTRWLGAGLASALAVMTLGLTATGQLGLYVNPDSAWFAVGMSLIVLAGTVASFALPLGAEADHGHDHGDAVTPGGRVGGVAAVPRPDVPEGVDLDTRLRRYSIAGDAHAEDLGAAAVPRPDVSDGVDLDTRLRRSSIAGDAHAHDGRGGGAGRAASMIGGVAASVIVVLALALPPASLSAELAMSRDTGAPPLFGGADTVALAKTGDTASFGIGDWSTVFATTTNPEAFDGEPVTLTGFATPGDAGFDVTRLVITHCVIDAQPASLPVSASGSPPETGQWVTVTGAVRARSDGRLVIDAHTIEEIPEPADPYEY